VNAQAPENAEVALAWSPIGQVLNEYSLAYNEFEESYEALFCELEQLREQLAGKVDDLQTERRNLFQRKGQVVDQREEISRLTHQYEQQEARLMETQQELAQAHVELARMRKAAVRQPGASEDYSQKIAEVEQERSELEAELERVRSRAAEKHETVDRQQRELKRQRTEMGDEIKQLRKVIENMAAGDSAQTLLAMPKAEHKSEPATPEKGKSTNDPVVNSVMAQFAKLQKDVAQRRARKK